MMLLLVTTMAGSRVGTRDSEVVLRNEDTEVLAAVAAVALIVKVDFDVVDGVAVILIAMMDFDVEDGVTGLRIRGLDRLDQVMIGLSVAGHLAGHHPLEVGTGIVCLYLLKCFAYSLAQDAHDIFITSHKFLCGYVDSYCTVLCGMNFLLKRARWNAI